MFKLFVTAVIVAIAMADLDSRWRVFKDTYKKKYSPEEDARRKAIWISTNEYIEQHNELYNEGQSTFYLRENALADMTREEIAATMNGFRGNVTRSSTTRFIPRKNLPKTLDWRTKGYVTPIKDQGLCGSCWAFSTTGAIEGQHFKATGKLVSLSESNLVDCSEENMGCRGGTMDSAFDYVIKTNGIDTEASYPYIPMELPCHFDKTNVGATISRYVMLPMGNEAALQEAVVDVGPISVAIDANHPSFSNYGGGYYHEPDCSSTILDHAVLVVGYGIDEGRDYWLVKNSWGIGWGDEGYIQMSRNRDNNCGIATEASYPLV